MKIVEVVRDEPPKYVEKYGKGCLSIAGRWDDNEIEFIIFDDNDKKVGNVEGCCGSDALVVELKRIHMEKYYPQEKREQKLADQVEMLGEVISYIFDPKKFGQPILAIHFNILESHTSDESLMRLGFVGMFGGTVWWGLLNPDFQELKTTMLESGRIDPEAIKEINGEYESIEKAKKSSLDIYSRDFEYAEEESEKRRILQLRINALQGEGLPYTTSSGQMHN